MIIKVDKKFNFLAPINVPMQRLGKSYDGGYVIPTIALSADTLISLGLSTDWSFDDQWLKHNPKSNVHAYDGTIIPEDWDGSLKRDYDEFFQGNAIHFTENATTKNIKQILDRASDRSFLKMDIEGAEYDIFPTILKSNKLVGMVVEFHALDISSCRNQFLEVVKKLQQVYNIVHIHANNYSEVSDDTLPATLEISFLKKELCDGFEKRYNSYLPDLDMPNAASKEDYELQFEE